MGPLGHYSWRLVSGASRNFYELELKTENQKVLEIGYCSGLKGLPIQYAMITKLEKVLNGYNLSIK